MNAKNNLKKRVIKAGSWTVIGHIVSQAIRLASNLIMTRLLVPEMFGVMAVANVFIIGLEMFSDLGLRQNIIQSSRGEESAFLNTVWIIQVIRGFILGLMCCGISYGLYLVNQSGLIASDNVYSDPILPLVIAVLALSPLISGFESTKLATSNRNLQLNRVTIIELLAQLSGVIVMLIWVNLERSIWALVSGGLFSVLAKTCLTHLMLYGRSNRLQWDGNAFNEVFHFGKWMFLASVLGFLINNGDKLLLGGLLSTEMLGVYSIAAFMASAVQSFVFRLIGNVAFPALGEVKRLQPERVKLLYYKIRQPIDVFCLLVAGILFTFGETIVNLLYDNRYSEAGSILEILALNLLIIRFGVAGQFYIILGKPKIMTILMVTRLFFMFIFIPLGFLLYQEMGAVWGLVLASVPGLSLTFFFKKKFGLLEVINELKTLPVFALGVLVGIVLDKTSFIWLTIKV